MPSKYNDILESLLKISPIVFFAVGMKIAIQIQRKKATVIGSLISIFVGVGMAYLTNDFIIKIASKELYPIILSLIAIVSDKIMEFLVFKLDVGIYIEKLLDLLFDKIKKFFN